MQNRRALIAINPEARRAPKPADLRSTVTWLEERGWCIESVVTKARGEVEEAAKEAACAGFDCVVACGGDGTLHEALNGLVGTQTALALLPSGTANVWALEAGLPKDADAALRLLDDGDRLRLDTGRVAGRYFLLMASIGLDSLVAGRVSSRLKRVFGFLPYIGHAAYALKSFDGFGATVTVDGATIETPAVGLIVGNTRSYGGLMQITPKAKANDGLLDVCLYSGNGRLDFLGAILDTLLKRHIGRADVTYCSAKNIMVETDRPWPVQLDGEVVAQTPVTITCIPQSLTVIVPHGFRSPLWEVAQSLPQ
jgi:diacylglycerol kinase (ATP)